jgi:hypothetical protein
MQCPVRSRYPNEPLRSFTILECSINSVGHSRDSKFKPLLSVEIHAAGDKLHSTSLSNGALVVTDQA